ncbi:MAG: Mur ligase family protein [Nitrospiraceae bacterium]
MRPTGKFQLNGSLRSTGTRVGLYTSPHIEQLCERIDVDGAPVGERTFLAAFNELRPFLEGAGKELTHFELLTVVAFCAFRAEQVDWAVIEVGIGGRLDATNVILPEVCVITTVDYDHMDLLGDTLEQIAFEKAGIIKPKVLVVVGAMENKPRAVILARAAVLDAPVFLLGHDYEARESTRTGYQGHCELRVDRTAWRNAMLNCPAAFMATNAAHARACNGGLPDVVPPEVYSWADGRPSPPDAGGGSPVRLLRGVPWPTDRCERRVAQCHGGGQFGDHRPHPVRRP